MKMKKIWLGLTSLLLVLAAIGLVGCGAASTGVTNSQQGIWVNGEGKVFATPDIATLSLGISAQSPSVAEAQLQAAEAMDKVMTALTEDSVATADIQTQQFSITQVTRWDDETREEIVIGYRVTNMVVAKVRDTDTVGTVIDHVAEAGGDLTRISSINFSVEDPAPYYEEARQKAVADAQNKAEQLAANFGVSLGDLTYVTESLQYPYTTRSLAIDTAPSAGSTSISPGEIELTLNIQAAYAIR